MSFDTQTYNGWKTSYKKLTPESEELDLVVKRLSKKMMVVKDAQPVGDDSRQHRSVAMLTEAKELQKRRKAFTAKQLQALDLDPW